MLRPNGFALRTFLTLVLSSLFAGAAYAPTWTVCSNGCDFTSIQEAVDSSISGDTIQLGAETFSEYVRVHGPRSEPNNSAFRTSILGAGANLTVVDGSFSVGQFCWPYCWDILLVLADMTIQNSTRCGIEADGGCFFDQCYEVSVGVHDTIIRDNGCGVRHGGSSMVGLHNTTVSDNDGHGFWCGNNIYGHSGLTSTTISNNAGYGVYAERNLSPIYSTNSTVSGNSAGVVLDRYSETDVVISQSTIVGNLGPGLLRTSYYGSYFSSFDVSGSIIADNEQENCWTTSGGHNLSSDLCESAEPSDILAASPQLMPLAKNGGPTPTHALATGSPAIDSGALECEPTDQRGVARPQDGDGDGEAKCDIGAFELVPIPVEIDIKPGGFPNSINPRSRGVIPVALLGSYEADVSALNPFIDVDIATLRFGPNEASCKHDLSDQWTFNEHLQDVNLDG